MQDTKNDNVLHLGETVLKRSEDQYNMEVAATIRGLGKLSSNELEEIAQGLKALGDFQELVAIRKGEPWTAEQRWSYLSLAAQIVIPLDSSKTTTGVKAWAPEQKQQFMNILVKTNILPPTLSGSPVPPSVPTVQPAVK